MKRLTVLLWFVFAMLGLQANNVRIVEDVKVGEISNGFANHSIFLNRLTEFFTKQFNRLFDSWNIVILRNNK